MQHLVASCDLLKTGRHGHPLSLRAHAAVSLTLPLETRDMSSPDHEIVEIDLDDMRVIKHEHKVCSDLALRALPLTLPPNTAPP